MAIQLEKSKMRELPAMTKALQDRTDQLLMQFAAWRGSTSYFDVYREEFYAITDSPPMNELLYSNTPAIFKDYLIAKYRLSIMERAILVISTGYNEKPNLLRPRS